MLNAGAGVFIEYPDGELRPGASPGGWPSLLELPRRDDRPLSGSAVPSGDNPAHTEDPIVVCTDSQSALATLQEGPATPTSPLGIIIWRALKQLERLDILQWVPSHCCITGNERVDSIANEAATVGTLHANTLNLLILVRQFCIGLNRWNTFLLKFSSNMKQVQPSLI